MSVETVKVVARVTALPDTGSALAPVLRSLIAPTRRESGCIRYELFENNSDPCDFVFVEEWSSHAAIDAHLAMPHVHDAFVKAGPFLAKAPEISRYSLIE
jgi:quinol monooxygenase YgiN